LTLHTVHGGYRDFLQKIWKGTPLYPLILQRNLLNRARFKIPQLPKKKFPLLWRIFELFQSLQKLSTFWRDMNDGSSN
jgi:hypothetical protein